MSNYTVYAFHPSDLGDGYTDEEIARVNELLDEELTNRNIEDARIICTENLNGYTIGIPRWHDDLYDARNAAIERFYAETGTSINPTGLSH